MFIEENRLYQIILIYYIAQVYDTNCRKRKDITMHITTRALLV